MTAVRLGLPSFRPAPAAKAERPDTPYLVDQHGRRATDLRVSLTDRCNLRCRYCMPADGLDWMGRSELLTTPELLRLLTLAVRDLGVTEVRFTGGEPLIRPDLAAIVAVTADLPERPSTSITTKRVGLPAGRSNWPRQDCDGSTHLRRRLGPAPFKALFEVIAGPLAHPRTPGTRFGGLRTVAFDGLNCTHRR